jgi:AAHS family 4-hydroxybenzoate transporter-like MFS transporter
LILINIDAAADDIDCVWAGGSRRRSDGRKKPMGDLFDKGINPKVPDIAPSPDIISSPDTVPSVGPVVHLTELLDRQQIGPFHIRVLLLCGLCCMTSGFYTVALGFIAPVASSAMHLGAGALGPAFAAMGLGTISGSFLCTPLADRIGRKPVIIGGPLFAVPFLFLVGTAESVPALMWRLYFAGFGLMGTVPIVLALAGEFMPKHSRVTLTMLVWIGFNIGSIATGLVASRLADGGNWHALFLINGAMPLVIAPILAVWLPESLDFLAEMHTGRARIARTLRQLNPKLAFPGNACFVLDEKEEHGFPVSLLFHEGRARLTLLLWMMFFTNIAALVFINSWLATLLVSLGIAKNVGIVIAAVTNAGGIIGGIVVSTLCDRYEGARFYILAAAYLLGGSFIAAIGFDGDHIVFAFSTAFMAGFFTYGAQNSANAVAATIYPTAMRSTGAGWAIGIGNSAQIFSPLLGGFLLAMQWPVPMILGLIALPTLLAALAAWSIGRTMPFAGQSDTSRPVQSAASG